MAKGFFNPSTDTFKTPLETRERPDMLRNASLSFFLDPGSGGEVKSVGS